MGAPVSPPVRRLTVMADRAVASPRAYAALRTAVVWAAVQDVLDERGGDILDVLDVGGGTGGFAVPLAELGRHRP